MARTQLDLEAVGRRMRHLRGFERTQIEVAGKLGIAQSYLSAIERGTAEPCATVLLAISQEFDVSIDWLLTGQQSTKKNLRRE